MSDLNTNIGDNKLADFCALNKLVIGGTIFHHTSVSTKQSAYHQTILQKIKTRKYHHKDWISTESIEKIKEGKKTKAVVNNSRTRSEQANAQVKYSEANRPRNL